MTTMQPPMRLALDASFGSAERWQAEAAALAADGPVALVFAAALGRLEHRRRPVGDDAAVVATLAHGSDGTGVDWAEAYARYQAAVHDASAGLGTERIPEGVRRLDVRRAGVYAQAPTMVPGATWRDPAAVAAWAAELPRNEPVVVYCVYGHEVGRSTALRLRAAGVDARFLEGGIAGWIEAGQPVVPRPGADGAAP